MAFAIIDRKLNNFLSIETKNIAKDKVKIVNDKFYESPDSLCKIRNSDMDYDSKKLSIQSSSKDCKEEYFKMVRNLPSFILFVFLSSELFGAQNTLQQKVQRP